MRSVGVWLFTGMPTTVAEEREQFARIERLGYASVWYGESIGGRDVFARAAIHLAATQRLAIGTGIANVWARQPPTMQAGGRAVAAAFPGRFTLGIGIGHPYQAASIGADFTKPLSHMRDYLSRMDEEAAANPPAEPFPRVLAAIGPKMLELARDAADGAHPFFMPVRHTAFAREVLGTGKLLIPHQAVLAEPDPVRAREIARPLVEMVLTRGASSYPKAWRDFGYDLSETSDHLVDSAVAWGDEQTIAKRVGEQFDAGADQVLVSPVADTLPEIVDQLERLAPALLGTL